MDKIQIEFFKTKLMMEGKVYLNDINLPAFEEFLKEKDIPYFVYSLFKNKNLLELDNKKIIQQLFGED